MCIAGVSESAAIFEIPLCWDNQVVIRFTLGNPDIIFDFSCKGHGTILLHKPHPGNELKGYQVQQLIDTLEQEELI